MVNKFKHLLIVFFTLGLGLNGSAQCDTTFLRIAEAYEEHYFNVYMDELQCDIYLLLSECYSKRQLNKLISERAQSRFFIITEINAECKLESVKFEFTRIDQLKLHKNKVFKAKLTAIIKRRYANKRLRLKYPTNKISASVRVREGMLDCINRYKK